MQQRLASLNARSAGLLSAARKLSQLYEPSESRWPVLSKAPGLTTGTTDSKNVRIKALGHGSALCWFRKLEQEQIC